MLTRLYVNGYKSLVKFEYRPGRRQLILGANGSGKSTIVEVLSLIRRIAVEGEVIPRTIQADTRTRWYQVHFQDFELEVVLGEDTYHYVLTIEFDHFDPTKPWVQRELLLVNDRPRVEFIDGAVDIHDERGLKEYGYVLDRSRSALATLPESQIGVGPTRFRQWLASLYCFRLNPFQMSLEGESWGSAPDVDLRDFVDWYSTILRTDPLLADSLSSTLRQVLVGFHSFLLRESIPGTSYLVVRFFQSDDFVDIRFDEISDGQRCLICLYAILHFVVERGNTVLIDEPDNFVALREIQPWLIALDDAIDDGKGQVLLISHHPELINQWATDYGVELVRGPDGATQVRKLQLEGGLPPAELIARGWQGE